MFNIVICDQDDFFVTHASKALYEFYEARNFEVNLQAFSNGAPYANNSEKSVDLLLMSTRPDGKVDYRLAEQIRRDNPKVQIFFMSDYDEDVFEAANHQPFCYIRKQFWRRELMAALNKLWETIHKGNFLQIKVKRRIIAVMIDEIMYLESSGHYVVLHCITGTLRTREKLPFFIEKLKGMYFIQPSKSFLVNCNYIVSCTDVFTLTNGQKIVCTKTRYRATIDSYEKYVREMHTEKKF